MSDAAVNVNSNVTIKVLDEHNKVIRLSKMHNKATMHMVTGLLEFLSGAFNTVTTNPKEGNTTPVSIRSYIPVKLYLGNVGVKMTKRNTDKPLLSGINSSDFKIPTFDDYRLQNDITQYYTAVTSKEINFDTISLTSFDDPNNSMGLLLQTKLPAGRLVGVGTGTSRSYFIDSNDKIGSGHGWVYYNTFKEVYEAIFTEIGLVSDTGVLLARVLFDGDTFVTDEGEVVYDIEEADNNPLIQSDKTSLVIEWRIGIISLGANDEVISEANTVPQLPNISERNILRNYITGNSIIINIPDNTKIIRANCFNGLSRVKTIILPDELGIDVGPDEYVIGDNAFLGCVSLEAIFYKGSITEWDQYIADKISTIGNEAFLRLVERENTSETFTVTEENEKIYTLSTTDIYTVDKVMVNNTETTNYTVNTQSDFIEVILDTAPSVGVTVVIDYTLPNQVIYNYVENIEED